MNKVGAPGRLHNGNQAPEAARERINAASHRYAGVMLADGAADGINAPGAGAAAAGDLVPINRILPPCPRPRNKPEP